MFRVAEEALYGLPRLASPIARVDSASGPAMPTANIPVHHGPPNTHTLAEASTASATSDQRPAAAAATCSVSQKELRREPG